MKRPFKTLRAAAALAAGILLALAVSSPASAAPMYFETNDLGEDLCTYYETAGEAEWPTFTVEPVVVITGKAATTVLSDRNCLHVIPYERHIEFVAYADDRPVSEHREALENSRSSFEYSFSLESTWEEPIDYLTVAICRTVPSDVPYDDCTEPVYVYPGPVTTG
ncbi:hypothetical protein [Glycomyces buryatensis]|uniref:Uncharacterized protein n=1 Tax=Glycomyces buryatensis TaxID=2570927 RepID=A0A4S8QK00_9ACTN|nr:hypothetical protein [Glycomyces buryatensis]THV41739.1 hypothetical protein FAB82_10140 [Glycomyces buryatensis]